jgi:RHS repeat-associated protein
VHQSTGAPATSETTYIGSLYELIAESGQQKALQHIFAGSQRIATTTTNLTNQTTSTNYYHGDHLGSSNVITDQTGVQVALTEFTPFGSTFKQTGSYDPKHKFTGKELDASTNLYFYGARYYDHEIGRFITADTFVQAPYDPQSLNRYAYCRNNPINYVDPSGNFWFIPLIIGAIKGAIVGAAIGAAVAAATGTNIGQGALTGAISGAFFGFTGSLGLPAGLPSILGHTIAGAASGAINASVTGGDAGLGAAIGGASAGASEFLGAYAPFLGQHAGEGADAFIKNFLARAATGAIIGGGVSAAMGASFGSGAQQGAITSAIGYTANHWLHDNKIIQKITQGFKQWAGRVFAGTRYGGGVGGSAKVQAGPIELGVKMHNITGHELNRSGEWKEFYEEKYVIYGKAFDYQLNVYSNEDGKATWFKPSYVGPSGSDFTVKLGGTVPLPQTGGSAAINRELSIDLKEVLNFREE